MHLVRAHVTKFKSVTDSTPFNIDSAVTALVGKNESGKTAVLEAMYRARPIAAGYPTGFEELRDYPRRFRARDRKSIPLASPVALVFELDDADVAAVDGRFGEGALTSKTVTVSRAYGSANTAVGVTADEAAALRHIIDTNGLDVQKYAKQNRDAVVAALKADEASEAALQLATELADRDIDAEIRNQVFKLVPRFQYFDEYSILPGVVSIEKLQNTDEDDLDAGERTALALLRLAGVDSDEFTGEHYEERKAALEAAGNELTSELFEYWTQNDGLRVELDIEFRPIVGDPTRAPEPFLQVRVRNDRHQVTLNMNQRSKGFIWFFSFLAAFSEYAEEDRRIILLDEPGLNLHAKAQSDLLRYIDERLAPGHQVIYSTHSLFMISPTKLERCRTVEDIDPTLGTVVSEDIWSARPDTVFPLLGALGVDMAQTLIIGSDQLLVEGPADVVYLTIMSDVLRSSGRTALDPRWTLTPAGGIDKIPTFISLLNGTDLNVTVLIDGAVGGNQKINSFIDRGLLAKNKLIPLTDITATTQADIEDMFDVAWYLKLLNAGKVGKFVKSKLPQGVRVVKRVEAGLGHKFDHFQPANFLLRTPGSLLDEIDDATKDRFETLFNRLNDLLS
ncbi:MULTISPECIES: AAA family ATPase [unclassified Mycobacterium]|uniref:AAA family ATPase n=1 Tax=unclassified Mycobacterium TaxID=2642494 RepID=UPI0029C6208F|nr:MULTISPECIES: AAA family ATPase [unclassified Mycobacterium]